jgi:hypothetical protein
LLDQTVLLLALLLLDLSQRLLPQHQQQLYQQDPEANLPQTVLV